MNERIKELAEEAGFITDPLGNLFGGDDIDRFAELIVKDVFSIIKEACLDASEVRLYEIINDRLEDAAGDVVDAYGIEDRIY